MTTLYLVITWIVLAILVAGSLTVAAKLFFLLITKKRKERIEYVRQFKKGKSALIFVIVIPLLLIGKLYDDVSFWIAFFESIQESLSLIVMNFSFDSVGNLMAQMPVYATAIYLSFVLIILNAALFVISVFQQELWMLRYRLYLRMTKRQKLILIGYNKESLAIYKSEKSRPAIIVGKISKEQKNELYIEKVHFISTDRYDEYLRKVMERAHKSRGEGYIVVINTHDDTLSAALCKNATKFISAHCNERDEFIRFYDSFKAYVYGDPKYEAIFVDFENHSKGCLTYLNKYRQIAYDFVDKYPLARFMDKRQIGDDLLVRDGVDINVVMIGFGKTNRQVFLTSVANNQFLQRKQEVIDIKKVNYYVYDCLDARNDKNLNHNYYRFEEELRNANPSDYLPLPSEPANDEFYFKLDVSDFKFYSSIREQISSNMSDVNFAIIAFGDDLENIDMAQKLLEKKKEWGVENFVLFVKTRATLRDFELFERNDCYPFGVEKECVYDIGRIVNGDITAMAKRRNRLYAMEKSAGEDVQSVYRKADLAWHTQYSQAERESNIYACLSLRSKLNLMGLDYVKQDEAGEALTLQDYMSIYNPNESDQGCESRRMTMAIHEHYRWNAYMISKGFVPATIREIIDDKVSKDGKEKFTNGKNYSLRKHGNLTTWEGLVEFRRMIAKRDGVDEEQVDVMKYDYQLMDEAYWLSNNGYKIIKKRG